MKQLILALALAWSPFSAHAEIVTIKWDTDGRFTHGSEIRPGGFLELCGKIAPGPAIEWAFTSSAPVESNVHYHEGKNVVYPAKHRAAVSITDRLVVGSEQEYCWMWTNRAIQVVRVDVKLQQRH